jgi:hypothetical protein
MGMSHRRSPGVGRATRLLRPVRLLAVAGALLGAAVPTTAHAAAPSAARSAAAWQGVAGQLPATHNGRPRALAPRRFRAFALDRSALASVLGGAPTAPAAGRAARGAPLTVSIPDPAGGFQRFAVEESSVLEPGLAAAHPEIRTYRGSGLDDPAASVRLDLTPLGFHASVRAPDGSWYVDPYYQGDQSRYVSYRGADLAASPHGSFEQRDPLAAPAAAAAGPAAPARAAAGPLRTYRLALVSDPAFAAYYGTANVTAAKATLVNRIDEIYENDLAIHLSLVNQTDDLNLDTTAKMTGAGGPCGPVACYTTTDAAGCDDGTLDRTQFVLAQLVGASGYDVGHLAMGVDGGGLAYLGVAGDTNKAGGCTGITKPIGDLYAVDYVAHELGHQFAANHTFAGHDGSCAGNASGSGVEPGSGSTIMAYAGICDTDNLQPHSDPYFSQRSITEISAYVGATATGRGEVQIVSLGGFGGSDSFTLTYNGGESAPITLTSPSSYTAPMIKSRIQAIPGFPAGVTVTVRNWADTGTALDTSGFRVTFSGAVDRLPLSVTSPIGLTDSAVGEAVQGGPRDNGGATSALGDDAPVVTAPPAATIPVSTPFALTGAGTDDDGDTLTYMWEQNDPGSGATLLSDARTSGPLFRVFGTAALVTSAGSLLSPSPGENAAGTSPTRVFPDLAQVVAGNTNATGSCPAGNVDCFSELLPTPTYANATSALDFRLTARDGRGGVAHADTTLTLAPAAGPFRVTSQPSGTSIGAGTPTAVTWSVAGTDAAPVSTADVRISLSTDGGLTFPTVLTAATPNDGTATVTLPNVPTTHARIMVAAVGNVFFDVSHADFAITASTLLVTDDAPPGGVSAQYSDASTPPVTVSATDEDTAGSALTALATGLPTGLALVAGTPADGPPGTQTWTVAGTTTAAPATYPVQVTVDDGDGHTAATTFDVTVTPEDAALAYAGDTQVTGAAGAATATAQLRFTVTDSAAVPGATDVTPGDAAGATVTFKEGATTLCAAVPVVTSGSPASGTATCPATLATDATHHITATAGGRYQGSGAADVEVVATPGTGTRTTTDPGTPTVPTTPATPTTPTVPTTPTGTVPTVKPPLPAAALLAPDLAQVAKRLTLATAGRVTVKLRCRTRGSGAAPARCTGKLTLTARIKGRKQTIGTASFSFPRTATKAVTVRLTARARAALKRATAATLSVSVTNAGRAAVKATAAVKLVPRSR